MGVTELRVTSTHPWSMHLTVCFSNFTSFSPLTIHGRTRNGNKRKLRP